MPSIVLGGGCFWGMEELFRTQAGVTATEVGYAGGENEHPTYEFHPGHAEVLQVTFAQQLTSLDAVLDYFFRIHDPTTIDQQGNDIGTSYRSVILYADEQQKKAAYSAIQRNQKFWQNKIVTSIEPLDTFWTAEEYHQDYLQKYPDGYICHFERQLK